MFNREMNGIYLDNAATTMVDKRVVKIVEKFMVEEYGNPSSLHKKGERAKWFLEQARKDIAMHINASSDKIFFTSGGTEANNWAIKGIAFANKSKGRHIITTKVEHKCVLECCKWLEEQGFEISYLGVDKEGFIDLNELKNTIREDTLLVSVIHGNNEIGTINDIESIGRICREKGVYFHTDACQSFTKTDIDVKRMNIDLMTLNAHKIHGPKGVGALFINENVKIVGWQHGGGQEKNMRSGTENVPGIMGFAEAVKISFEDDCRKKMEEMRDRLIKGIMQIPYVKINGPVGKKRLCNNINCSFRFIEGEAIVGMLNEFRIFASTGSACSEKSLEPSYVLKALGLGYEEMNGSLRLSLSRFNTREEIDYALNVLSKVVKRLREYSPYGREEKNVY